MWHVKSPSEFTQAKKLGDIIDRVWQSSGEEKPLVREPVAFFYRFHTDASLAGEPNVRSWTLAEGKPSPGLYREGEVRLLFE